MNQIAPRPQLPLGTNLVDNTGKISTPWAYFFTNTTAQLPPPGQLAIDPQNVNFTGGQINGTLIGNITPDQGTFTIVDSTTGNITTLTSSLANITDVVTTDVKTNTLEASGLISSTFLTSAPLSVLSTAQVANLNVSKLEGLTWEVPGTIGSTTPNSVAATTIAASGVITSTLSTGTAPLSVLSTTQVANLNASYVGGLSTTQLSTLTTTQIATLVDSGTLPASLTTITASGQISSTLATGTAPLSVLSSTQVSNLNVSYVGGLSTAQLVNNLTTTQVSNLNSSYLEGLTWEKPGAIGSTTPNSAAHTTISASGQISSTVATGTAPIAVLSTTQVNNLNVEYLQGLHSSAFQGAGIYITPTTLNNSSLPAALMTISATGVITSTLATGTAPLSVLSSTQVSNLNASYIAGLSTTQLAVLSTAQTFNGLQTFANGITSTSSSNSLGATSFSGAITGGQAATFGATTGTTGNFTNATAGLLTVGTSGTTNGASLNIIGNTQTYYNWQIGTAVIGTANNLTFTQSTAAGGSTFTTPIVQFTQGGILSGQYIGTSASANSLSVGRLGSTTPAFNVDSSTASQVAGLNVAGAATGGTVAITAIDSGSNTNISFNAKGNGTFALNTTGTGAVSIGNATGGVSVSGAVTATGTISPRQAATVSAPAYVKGAMYFDTTLNKLRIGGATAWETVTSV